MVFVVDFQTLTQFFVQVFHCFIKQTLSLRYKY